MYFKTFKKVILSMYILILIVKIIKPQFPTLDTTIAEFPAQCFEHNLKTAFNLALNFSGWCILIFFKSKASGTIYKHDMSHLLFWGGRCAGECFFNCTTDYLQFCFRWNILDTRLLLLSCIIRVRTLVKSVWLSVSSYLCPIIRPVICHFPIRLGYFSGYPSNYLSRFCFLCLFPDSHFFAEL